MFRLSVVTPCTRGEMGTGTGSGHGCVTRVSSSGTRGSGTYHSHDHLENHPHGRSDRWWASTMRRYASARSSHHHWWCGDDDNYSFRYAPYGWPYAILWSGKSGSSSSYRWWTPVPPRRTPTPPL